MRAPGWCTHAVGRPNYPARPLWPHHKRTRRAGVVLRNIDLDQTGFSEALLVEGGADVRPLLDGCRVRCSGDDAVNVTGRADPYLRGCELTGRKCGVRAYGEARGLFERCTLTGCGEQGVKAMESAAPALSRCVPWTLAEQPAGPALSPALQHGTGVACGFPPREGALLWHPPAARTRLPISLTLSCPPAPHLAAGAQSRTAARRAPWPWTRHASRCTRAPCRGARARGSTPAALRVCASPEALWRAAWAEYSCGTPAGRCCVAPRWQEGPATRCWSTEQPCRMHRCVGAGGCDAQHLLCMLGSSGIPTGAPASARVAGLPDPRTRARWRLSVGAPA